jgi:transposase
LTTQLIKLKQRIIELSRGDKYRQKAKLVKGVPGIGPLIAMELLVELSDIERFARADGLASHIELTPSEFSTGEYLQREGSPGV